MPTTHKYPLLPSSFAPHSSFGPRAPHSPFVARLRPLAYLLGAIAPIFIATPVFAETVGQSAQLEEILVTASKRKQSLQDVAGSVTVVTGKALQKPQLNLSDIAALSPGFSLIENGPRNPTPLVMRGVRLESVTPNDLGSDGGSVASYVDNIPLQGYFAPPAFVLKDLQQVEVLRGPQGTLYGNASVGGLVRYITAKPDLTQVSVSIGGAISQTAESDDLNYDTDLVVNLPVAETVGLRLLLSEEQNAGFIDNPYLLTGAEKDINDDETSAARLSVLWQPSDEFSLAGSYHYQQVEVGDRQASNKAFTGDDYAASSHYLQPMKGDLRLASIDASYQFDWAEVTASINRYDYESKSRADQTDFLLTLDDLGGWGFYSADEDFSAYTSGDVSVLKDSVELRLVSPDDQPMRWLLGAFYSTDDLSATVADTAPGFAAFLGMDRPDDLDYYAIQEEELREQSVYAEVAYDIKPEWEVLVGARSFRYVDDVSACDSYPISYGIEGNDLDLDCWANSNSHTGTLGKFSTKYKLSEDQSIYFTVAEGFRRGGANAVPVDVDHNRTYEPDTAVNYELGMHSYLMNQQVRLSGALFYIDWEDIQVLTAIDGYYGGFVNAKSARSQGLELEANAQISGDWSLRAGFSLTDAELTEDVESISGGYENAYAGDTLPGSPRYQWNFGVDYAHEFDSFALNGSFTFSRLSEIYTELNDEFVDYERLAGYNMASARLGVSLRNWQVGAFVNNIANTRAVTGRRSASLHGEQGQFEYISRPRTIGLSFNYTY